MKKEDQNYLMYIIGREGFDYSFCDYSSFLEIEDERFHELRKEYKKAAEVLKQYIGFYD